MSKHKSFNNGNSLEDTVKKVLEDGDLSKLKDLGPAAQKALNTLIFGSRAAGSTSQSTTQSAGGSSTQPQPPSQYPPPQTRPFQVARPPSASPRPKRINRRIDRGVTQIILGSLGVFCFGAFSPLFLATAMSTVDFTVHVTGIVLAVGATVVALVSAWLLAQGIGRYRRAGRTIQLITLLQNKKVYALDKLAAETNRLPKQLKRDLRKIRAEGTVPEIRTDVDETYVMWGQDTYEQYLLSEETRQQKIREEESRRLRLENPATAGIERFRNEGKAVILKIRAANDAIPGEGISAKLDTLESTVTRIFSYVERYPEKLPDIRKFMDHYLPLTLKLVEKYHQYDEMDFEPQNVRKAKAEIERSMDTVNVAFNNLLESLFAHDTLDVATDIVVLEKILEQEGLTGNTFKTDLSGSTQKAQ